MSIIGTVLNVGVNILSSCAKAVSEVTTEGLDSLTNPIANKKECQEEVEAKSTKLDDKDETQRKVAKELGDVKMMVLMDQYDKVVLQNKKDEEAKKRTLLIDVPTLLFPAVRSLVTRLTSESGFPTFAMQPVDFATLYEQKQAK